MAGLYDTRIEEAKQKQRMADLLRQQSLNQQPGQMVSGWYVPNTGGAIMGALGNILGAYQENQANKELKDIEQERGRDYIRLINQMGMSAPESMVNQYGTPEEKPGFIDRTVAFLKGEEAPTKPAIPFQQNVAQNVTPEQKRNALMEYQLMNGGDISKISGFESNMQPHFFSSGGKVFAVNANNPLQANPVMANGVPLTNDIYDPTAQGNITFAKEGNKILPVETSTGAKGFARGSQVIGEQNANSLHVGDIIDGKTYIGGHPNDPSSWR